MWERPEIALSPTSPQYFSVNVNTGTMEIQVPIHHYLKGL